MQYHRQNQKMQMRCDAIFMIGTSGYINQQGTCFANVISRPGRNEIQFYSLLDSEARPLKIELSDDLEIVAACWFVENSHNKTERAKKRKLDDANTSSNVIDTTEYFVVGHSSGKIAVFSALQNSEVNSFHLETAVVAMTTGEKSILCLDTELSIIEVTIPEGKKLKTKIFKDISDIQAVQVYMDKNKKQNYILGNQHLSLVDPSKPKNFLVSRFQGDLLVVSIKASKLHPTVYYAIRENDQKIYVYDVETQQERTHAASSAILSIYVCASGSDEAIFVVSETGIEVFVMDFESDFHERPPACLIRTSSQDDEVPVRFSAVCYRDDSLTGIWYKGLQPQFEDIDWNFKSVGEVIVSIQTSEKEPASKVNTDTSIIVPKLTEIKNIPSEILFDKIRSHLQEPEKLIHLCSTNNDEASIKEVVKSFSAEENGLESISKLYEIVSHEVASKPDDTAVLALWLKWILLTHGGALSKSGDHYSDFKQLQKGLSKGMEQMPQLLALQGRLQLLRAQAQLRDTLIEVEEPEEVGRESSVVYANGEDDDEIDEDEEDEEETKVDE